MIFGSEVGADGQKINTTVEKPAPPIVSASIWDHVQAILAEQAGSQSRLPKQDLFVGMITCHCGTLMERVSKSSDYPPFESLHRPLPPPEWLMG